MSTVSIVIPTYNCAREIGPHLDALAPCLQLADEVVVVDSHSSDGTLGLLRERLVHPRLTIELHPRGLYQSWNRAISLTRGDWIYISTVGDTIGRGHLEHLLATGEARNSDVVLSQPLFKSAPAIQTSHPVWPATRIIREHGLTEPGEIPAADLFRHAIRVLPESYLGSSASNLYRGDHLRARPFPADFGLTGDTAWSLLHALNARVTFTPDVGSVFLFHEKSYQAARYAELADIERRLLQLALDITASPAAQGVLGRHREYLEYRAALHQASTIYGLARRKRFPPWFLSPAALKAKGERNRLRSQAAIQLSRLEAS